MPKIRVKVDTELCIGAASCVVVAEQYFEMNSDNKAMVKNPELPTDPNIFDREMMITDEQKELIVLAAKSCPTLAVFIYDELGTQIFPEL